MQTLNFKACLYAPQLPQDFHDVIFEDIFNNCSVNTDDGILSDAIHDDHANYTIPDIASKTTNDLHHPAANLTDTSSHA